MANHSPRLTFFHRFGYICAFALIMISAAESDAAYVNSDNTIRTSFITSHPFDDDKFK